MENLQVDIDDFLLAFEIEVDRAGLNPDSATMSRMDVWWKPFFEIHLAAASMI
jgi:hypothetical protein